MQPACLCAHALLQKYIDAGIVTYIEWPNTPEFSRKAFRGRQVIRSRTVNAIAILLTVPSPRLLLLGRSRVMTTSPTPFSPVLSMITLAPPLRRRALNGSYHSTWMSTCFPWLRFKS